MKLEKIKFFYTFYFIFKISTYKKNSKLIGKNSSLVTFFLTTRYVLCVMSTLIMCIPVGFIHSPRGPKSVGRLPIRLRDLVFLCR